MPETNLSYPEILVETGHFFRYILENLSRYAQEDADWKLELPPLGSVSIKSLDLLFQIVWRLNRWPETEKLLICLDGPGQYQRFFSIETAAGRLAQFAPQQQSPEGQWRTIRIDLTILAQNAGQDKAAFLISLLRGEGITLSSGAFVWQKVMEKIAISPTTFEAIVRWFFPFSGVGLIIRLESQLLPLVFYGGKPARLHLKSPKNLSGHSWRALSQAFRQKNRLALVFGIASLYLERLLYGEINALEFIESYGEAWLFSTPAELDDFIFHLPQLLEFLPGFDAWQKCNLDRGHIFSLLQSYLHNAYKYLKQQSIYLKLKDHEDALLLEINASGIYEAGEHTVADPQNLFTIDIEVVTTLMAWLNDTSLRLMTRFIDGIVPTEFSEKIEREEILIYLRLQNDKREDFDLLICGGEHCVPHRDWHGDFSVILMRQPTRRVAFEQNLAGASLLITQEKNGYRVHFPVASCLHGKSLLFQRKKHGKFALGISRLISPTSLFAEIAPGLRSSVILGEIDEGQPLPFNGASYRIVRGSLLWVEASGRILKYYSAGNHISHIWLLPQQAGFHLSAISYPDDPVAAWWKNFVAATEQGGLSIDNRHSDDYEPARCLFPQRVENNYIEMDNKQRGIGFRRGDKLSKPRFWLLQAWAVPFDKQGNLLVRARAIVNVEKVLGFALLEFPCRLPDVIIDRFPLPLQIKKHRQTVSFFSGPTKLLTIANAGYLRLLKPGWRWSWSYLRQWLTSDESG